MRQFAQKSTVVVYYKGKKYQWVRLRVMNMTKIDIISGFLGAGKTTLIRKLIQEVYNNEKIVLIENEFGEIGIDGGFLKEAGITIKEMNSGCICCSLVGDFAASLEKVMEQFEPERIIIEPSGVGKLSDVIKAIRDLQDERLELNSYTAVVDGKKAKIYMKNFGEFFNNQIEFANTIILSRTQLMNPRQLQEVIALLREHNTHANLIATPWEELKGDQIREAMEHPQQLAQELMKEMDICPICHHHHDHEHEHVHHHDHDHDHAHHHDHEGHHHHHHADDVFTSWGQETMKQYAKDELQAILEALANEQQYGTILRAKGMVPGKDHTWLYFDLVPGEYDIRPGTGDTIGKLCVIGSELRETELAALFGLGR